MRIVGIFGLACIGLSIFACGDSADEPPATANDAGTTPPPAGDDDDDDVDSGPPIKPTDAGKKDSAPPPPVDAGPFVPAPHPTYPQMPTGGNVMTNPKIVTIVAPGDPLANDLFAFGDAVVASNWWKTIGTEYGLGTATHVKITGGAIAATVTNSQMKQYVTSAITGHADAQPDGNTIFLLYLPKTTNDVNPSTGQVNDANCSEQYGGYHQLFGQKGDAFAFARRCPASGLSEIQNLTVSSSHEIIESATDPFPEGGYAFGQATTHRTAWEALPGGGEVGDLCNPDMIKEGSFYFARVWSNASAASGADPCAPAVTPYFNAAPTNLTADGWYKATNGKATIPITGYSTARIAVDWFQAAFAFENGIDAVVVSPTMVQSGTQKVAKMNNGTTGTLTVTGGSPGQNVVVDLYAIDSANTIHVFPVGIRF